MSEVVQWKTIPYTDGKYQANTLGKIRRVLRSGRLREVPGSVINKGYRIHTIIYRGRRRTVATHRIIYETFTGAIPDGLQINHKDGRKLNNRISNLEVVTQSENMRHAWRTGLISPGEKQLPYKIINWGEHQRRGPE